jgi:hypothetical protein
MYNMKIFILIGLLGVITFTTIKTLLDLITKNK